MTTNLTLAPFSAEGDWHPVLPRYVLCARWARGRRVLDLTCGRGVGCEILRRLGAAYVVGVDTREEVVRWAQHQFGSDRVEFLARPLGGRLPFPEAQFDVVLALNPLWSAGRDQLAEVHRVLADGGTFVRAEPLRQSLGLGHLLPRYDRRPPAESRERIDEHYLTQLFGESLTLIETPSLVHRYQVVDETSAAGHWPRPESTLASDDGASPSLGRLRVYGLSAADARAARSRVIELPYPVVVQQLARMLDEGERELEVLTAENRRLDDELVEKESLVANLDLEVRNLRQQIVDERGTSGHWRTPRPSPEGAPPAVQDQRAYIDELWSAVSAWQQHAEALQTALQTARAQMVQQAGQPLQPESPVQRDEPLPAGPPTAIAPVDYADESLPTVLSEPPTVETASDREAALVRELEAVEAALASVEQTAAKQMDRVAQLEDALQRSKEEIRQRDARIKHLESDVDDQRARFNDFTAEAAEVLEQRNQLERELRAAERQAAEASTQTTKSQETTVSLEHDIRSKAERIQTLEREQVGLRVELTSRENEATRLMRANTALEREKDALLKRIQEAATAAKAKAKAKAKAEAEAEAEAKAKPTPPEPKPEPKEDTKPKEESKPKPKEEPKPKQESKPKQEPKPKQESKPKEEPKPKQEPKPKETAAEDEPKPKKPARSKRKRSPRKKAADKPKADVEPKSADKPKAKRASKKKAAEGADDKPKRTRSRTKKAADPDADTAAKPKRTRSRRKKAEPSTPPAPDGTAADETA